MFEKLKKFIWAKVFRKHYWRTGKCKGCGQCCTHIYVKHFKHVLKDEKEFKNLMDNLVNNLNDFYLLIFRCIFNINFSF